jgi:hypothetical protein
VVHRGLARGFCSADQITDILLGFIYIHIEGLADFLEGLVGYGLAMRIDTHVTHVVVIVGIAATAVVAHSITS